MAATDVEKVKLENTLRRFKRYLNVGFESSETLKSSSELDNIQSLHELITEFRNGGPLAIEQIRLMNKTAKLINRAYIVTALAFCARNSNADLESKRAAYSALKEVCTNPFELFLFLDKREFFNVQFLLKSTKNATVVLPSPRAADDNKAGNEVPERSVSTGEMKQQPEPAFKLDPPKLLEKRDRSRPSSSASIGKNGQPAVVVVEKLPLAKLADSTPVSKSLTTDSPRNSTVVLPKINHDPALATPRIGSGKTPLSPIPKVQLATTRSQKEDDQKPQMIGLVLPNAANGGKQKQQLSSKGWGRLQRKYVNDWYTSQDPVKLAKSIIKYQKKYNWSHRDIFRLSHPQSSSLAHNFIFKYVTGGLAQAQKFYESAVKADADFKATKKAAELSPSESGVLAWQVETKIIAIGPKEIKERKSGEAKKKAPKMPTKTSQINYQLTAQALKQLDSVRALLTAFDSLKGCKSEEEVCQLIRQNSFTDHQVPAKWLNSQAIWVTMLECSWFTPAALIRRFMKLARRQMIRKNLRDKLQQKQEERETEKSGNEQLLARIEQLIIEKLTAISSSEPPVYPVEIFTVIRLYEHAKNDRKANRFLSKKASWPVNESVTKALNAALEMSFQRVECSSERKLSFSLNCFKHSRARTRKNSSLTPFQAMALLFKTNYHESALTSQAFAISGNLVNLPIDRGQSFQALKNDLFNMYLGSGSSNHLAVEKALSDKEQFDAFVIYTNVEPYQLDRLASAFSNYCKQVRGKDARCKLVFISFSKISQSIVQDASNMNILELTGLSNQTPQIIANFLNDLF